MQCTFEPEYPHFQIPPLSGFTGVDSCGCQDRSSAVLNPTLQPRCSAPQSKQRSKIRGNQAAELQHEEQICAWDLSP